MKYCKEKDIQVICDLNYRGKMWPKEQAQVVMRDLMQYVDGKFYQSPIHRVHSLEAVGAGDAYGAAFVHGLINGFDPQKTVDFAISASVLKLMIQHDFNVVTQEDVFKIMNSKNTNLSR